MDLKTKGVCAVVGGQFGSEGKGAVVARIAREYKHHVRVGGANAGHTAYDEQGMRHVTQQIPVAAYTNPDAQLYIGPGAVISPEILDDELHWWIAWRETNGLNQRPILVDARAHVVRMEHKDQEQLSKLASRIGSTSAVAQEGIGAATAARVMREEGCLSADRYYSPEVAGGHPYIKLADVPAELSAVGQVLLEGTQGAGLSLTTGPFPYVTSRNTTAAGLLADCGVAPARLERVILVCRTFPIRVAGNSGPFWRDSVEMDWEELGVDPESERTTVTRKVRRVATFSMDQIKSAVLLNGATEIALMHYDYIEPDVAGLDGQAGVEGYEMASRIQRVTGVPVRWLGTGPKTMIELMEGQ